MTYIDATFIGRRDDLGFVKNNRYVLEMFQSYFGSRITVRPVHGYEFKPYDGYTVHYMDMGHFLQDWKIDAYNKGPDRRDWYSEREDYLAGRSTDRPA